LQRSGVPVTAARSSFCANSASTSNSSLPRLMRARACSVRLEIGNGTAGGGAAGLGSVGMMAVAHPSRADGTRIGGSTKDDRSNRGAV
jgi:hypothetical protein